MTPYYADPHVTPARRADMRHLLRQARRMVAQPRTAVHPTPQTPPKVCPGSGHLSLAVNIEGSTYRCLACGSMVRGWAFESGYRARYGLRRHAPGPDLPFHAWRDLVLARDGVMDVAACLCQTRAVL